MHLYCYQYDMIHPETRHCLHCGGPSYDENGVEEDRGCENETELKFADGTEVTFTHCCRVDPSILTLEQVKQIITRGD
jgi:hypothetical protein